jgi:hypothetical protein
MFLRLTYSAGAVKLTRVPVALFCLLYPAASLWAQAVAGGQIHGTVTDPTGAAVANADISVTQIDSGLRRTGKATSDGSFVFPNLPVGPYRFEINATGFSPYQQTGMVLRVGDDLLVIAHLQLGSVPQEIQVTGSATDVQTEKTSVSEVIDQQRIVDLPLNGRQATQLILLSGAATTAPAGDLNTSKNYPSSVTLSVAGGQANGTNYLMDGGDNNDAFTNVNLPFPFPDALQEFSVETTGLAARYGLHPGAVVNAVTKSGSNKFHGDLFEFIRNGDLNARNFFAAAQDTLRRNQFGGTIGGPILRNKLFFFFGYQGTQTRTTPPNTISFVPNAAMLNGDFSVFDSASCRSTGVALQLKNPAGGIFPGDVIPASLLNPTAQKILKYIPVSTSPCGTLTYGIPNPSTEEQYLGRVDWIQNEKHTLFARYFIADYSNPPYYNGNLLNTTRGGLADRSQSIVLGDNYSFSNSLLNSFHATGSRISVNRGPAADVINPNSVGIPISVPVSNYLGLSVSGNFSVGGTIGSNWIDNSWQASDDVDWIRGRHHVSFGADWIHNQLNTVGAINENGVFTINGQFTGDSMADFMLGQLSDFSQGNPTGGNFRQNYIGLYGQDDIRINPRLNVHFGLRWEPFLPEVDIHNRGASFSAAAFASGTQSGVYVNAPPGLFFVGDPGIPKGYFRHRLNDFEPRVGFAWDPTGNGRQSIRASYSIGYDTPELFYEARFETNAPFGSTIDIPSPVGGLSNPFQGYLGGNPFPLPFPPPKTQTFPQESVYVVHPINMRPTYMQQWDLSYQRQIGKGWVLTATYIGNKTAHIWIGTELDPAVYIPGTCGAAACSTTANTNQRRVLYLKNPSTGSLYSTVTQTDDGAGANYNGLILSAQHRFANNYTFLTNYTWSHCLSTGNFAGDIAGPNYQNPNNRDADYANCSFDVRQNFNLSIVAEMPRIGSARTSRIFGGWQLAPIFTAHTGAYFTPVTGADNSRTGIGLDRPNVISEPYVENLGNRRWVTPNGFIANAIGTYGNAGPFSLQGPGYFDLDVALSRTFVLMEHTRLDVRSEFFNVLNHTNFNNPSGTLSSQNFGVLLSAADPRILQFAMKLTF